MKLYKYCSYSANTLSILINGKVWYSKPADFNDPFDGDFLVDNVCSFDDYIAIFQLDISGETYEAMKAKYCDEQGNLKPEKLAEESSIAGVFKNVGVLCLTTRWDSTLMWSHYADQHRGLAIQFDIPNEIPVSKVNYAKVLPANHLSYYYKRTTNDGYIDIEFTKHEDWSYEDEYRLAVNAGNRLVENPGIITEVIFGCKMQNSHKETLSNLVSTLPSGKGVRLLSAEKVDDLSLRLREAETET